LAHRAPPPVQGDLARFKAHVETEDAKGIEYRAVREDDRQDDDADEAPARRDGTTFLTLAERAYSVGEPLRG
jgi:hypothetical protein